VAVAAKLRAALFSPAVPSACLSLRFKPWVLAEGRR
jgi:hypothetical protein